jgi:hypothetical protein
MKYSLSILTLSLTHTSASRAYPHGCLYRHPSYYTYDEREDISWANEGQFHSDVESASSDVVVHSSANTEEEHTDFRMLPPRSSKLRKSYNRYRLTRRLGAGKFSEVYEAVDLEYNGPMRYEKKRRKLGFEGRVYDGESTDCSTETEEDETDCSSLVVLKVSLLSLVSIYSNSCKS